MAAFNLSLRISAAKELAGASKAFRIREGDYRILYTVEGSQIIVFRIAHRRDVYRKPFF
ncbi:MAG: type II toxin-antitoxin system RelE/ParE family toxin [Candidatus Margulisiibacteriota bacterium]